MQSPTPRARATLPAHWRQVSFICFDLAVINVIGGAGAAHFYSQPLHALGFGRSSLALGVLLILIGLAAYQAQRLPTIVPIVIIVADVVNTIYFLPKFELAGGVVLVKLSFLIPVFLVFISMLRMTLKLRVPGPEEVRQDVTIGSGRQALALLSSMFVSVGTGMAALLLFAHFVMRALTEASNPFINIFHDLVLVPALLLLFPVGAALGELIWLQASRFYLTSNELAQFVRYLLQLPLISKLATRMIEQAAEDDMNNDSFTENSVTYGPPFKRRRRWRTYAVVSAVILVSAASFLVLGRGLFVSAARSDSSAATETAVTPGALVVSQDGRGHYKSIKAALAAASPGATIQVRAGTYYDAVSIDKNVTLIGDKGAAIECSQDGCLRITAQEATVKNFRINAKAGWLFRLLKSRQRTAAVLIMNGRTTIESSDVTSNNGVGIVVSGRATVAELRDVRAHDCYLNGIQFTSESTGVIENSQVYKNRWAGIRIDDASRSTIRRSQIHGGKMDGVLITEGGHARIENSQMFGNNYNGLVVRERSGVSLHESKSFKNLEHGVWIHHGSYGEVDSFEASDNKDSGIVVGQGSGGRITNTQAHGQKIAGIVVWHDSTAEIDRALIYDNSYGLWVETGGKPVVRNSVFRSHSYSAIDVGAGGEPLIEHSQIYGGQSAGVYFHHGGKGVVNECAIFGNAHANVVIESGGDPTIRKTRLSESRLAGVLVLDGGEGTISDSEIFNNYLGVEIRNHSTFAVENCSIKNNRHQGFVIDDTSEGSVTGSKLEANTDGPWKIAEGARIMRERNTE